MTGRPDREEDSVASTPHRARMRLPGIGDVRPADEGFGLRCIGHPAAPRSLPPPVQLPDGGGHGLRRLPLPEATDAPIVSDTAEGALPAGGIQPVEGDGVPALRGAKTMGLRRTGFQDAIAPARSMGDRPGQRLAACTRRGSGMTAAGCAPAPPPASQRRSRPRRSGPAPVAGPPGHGEVSATPHGVPAMAVPESVCTGEWGPQGAGLDAIAVGPVPALAIGGAHRTADGVDGVNLTLRPHSPEAPADSAARPPERRAFLTGRG